MTPAILITDPAANLMEENFKTFPIFKQNLCKYLQQIVMGHYQNNLRGNESRFYNFEQNAMKRGLSNAENETSVFINIDELVPFFIDECRQNFVQVDPCFVSYYLHLLIRDSEDGSELNMPFQGASICKIEQFLLKALAKYRNPADATVKCMRISYFCKNLQELSLDFVKEKCDLEFSKKLNELVNSILQYPETSNSKQLDEMFLKMQVFIITNYHIGYPENPMLLKQCRQSLNSILGKGDIQKYVLRKRYHRLEYLQKLGATAGGILIFNNLGSGGEAQSVRNIFADLKMAKCITQESLEEGFESVMYHKQKATEVMLKLFEINVQEKIITCVRPLIQIRELNKFVILFEVYRKKLENIKTVFEKTKYLMEVEQKKFDCVVEKIHEILKYRSAIESELIFPHFVYLSELWNSLVLHLKHLTELNKIKDNLDAILNEELEEKFNYLLEDLSDVNKYLKRPLKYSFQESINSTSKVETKLNMLNIKPFMKDYCALTVALTGGMLVPSQLEKKLCEDVDFRLGFLNMEFAKFAEHNFKDFIQVFRSNILTNSNLVVLSELDEEIMQQDFDFIQRMQTKNRSLSTQTEMISNENPMKDRNDVSWNIWDFYRQTITLTNIRKRQTQSTQSNLSFGYRNAQTQCERKLYNSTQK